MTLVHRLGCLLALLLPCALAQAQAPPGTPADTLRLPVGLPDAAPQALVGLTDAQPAPAADDGRRRLEAPVTFAARDSLVLVFSPEDPDTDLGTLFGSAETGYQEARLTAFEIDLLFRQETLRARGDTLGAGLPAFQRGSEGFSGRELAYNLATQRGRLVGARTQIEDGFILGGIVKQEGERVTFAQDVIYTTCDLEDHQHWGLHAHRMKIIDGEWVYTGPAQLHLLGIPTPLWLPFGFFPAIDGRRSGALPPDYGEQAQLGFFVRNIGYYWALSDYVDLQVATGLYTSGSFEVDVTTRYARRYWANGSLRAGFRSERLGEPQDPGFRSSRQGIIQWAHQQTLNAANTATLGGNVDLRSTGFSQTAQAGYQDRVQQQTTSRLTLSQRWRSGRNVSLSYNQNLNLTNGATTITLPSGSFNQPRFFPLRRAGSRGQAWYEQISLQYGAQFRNEYRFNPLNDTLLTPAQQQITWLDALFSPSDFRAATGEDFRFNSQVTHNVPLNARFSIRRLPLLGARVELNPSLTYNEEWQFRRNEVVLGDDGFVVRDAGGRPVLEQVGGFNPRRRATLSVNASTQAFGTFPWRVGPLDGFRHVLSPNVSLSYQPAEDGAFWGRFASVEQPDGTEVVYPTFGTFTTPPRERQVLGFSLANVFETRVARDDGTGAIQRTPLQLANLNLTSGYDLAADSLRWQNVGLTLRSSIANRIDVNYTAAFSPYAVDTLGQTVNRFFFDTAGLPLRFLQSSLSLTTRFESGQAGAAALGERAPLRSPTLLPDLDPITEALYPYDFRRSDLGFVDFDVPWSLDLDFSYTMRRGLGPTQTDQRLATLNAAFQLGLTPTWRLSGRTGYDFSEGRIVPSQLSVLRDLHCWEMSVNWIPFGQVRAFSFSIYVKSGYLRDLLRLNIPNTDRTQFF